MIGRPWFALALAGCLPPQERPDYDEFEVHWQIDERALTGPAGDAAISPWPVLLFEPEIRFPLIQTRMIREEAGIGQPAEMEVRILGIASRVRVRLIPSRPGIRVLGPEAVEVADDRPFIVLFTSDSPGRGAVIPVIDPAAR